MKAWAITKTIKIENNSPLLELTDIPVPEPEDEEIQIRVKACGVCHTEIDEIEGRTPPNTFPVIPGHQVAGVVEKTGKGVVKFKRGDRVAVGWIFSSCGKCKYCVSDRENLCEDFKATGRDANGGYGEFMKINENFAFLIPENFSEIEAAPLLCAGAIGYRSLRLTGLKNGEILGLFGFGASAHLVLKTLKYMFPSSPVFVFARSPAEREFAIELGAAWGGDFSEKPPSKIDCAIDTTPVWKPVLDCLYVLKPGGRLIINAIRKEDDDKNLLAKLNYPDHLWLEKEIKSVANVTRRDIEEFLKLASQIPLKPEVEEYPFEEANRAIIDLKQRKIRGAKVLKIS